MATLPALAKSSWKEPHQLILGAPAVARSEHDWVVVELDRQSCASSGCSSGHDSKKDRQGLVTDHKCEDMETHLRRCEEEVSRLRGLVKSRETIASKREPQLDSVQAAGTTQTATSPSAAGDSSLSPAALLQRLHGKAQLQQNCMSNVAKLDAPQAPLCAGDFPGLRNTEDTCQVEHDRPMVGRKLSYADMASQHVKLAAQAVRTESTHSRTASTVPATVKASAIPLPVALPAPGPATALKRTASKRASPRFAQPTAAFSRRADETARKDGTATTANKNSPVKPASISAAARQQKRKSLPGDWLASPSERTGNPSPAAGLHQAAEHAAQQFETSGPREEPILRKKTSTYMSPTKAAIQRTRATIGQGSINTPSMRLQHTMLMRLDTASAFNIAAGSQKSSPASPETTIETEMNVDRALRARSRDSELPGVVTRRRSTITAALPHSRRLPANTSIADLLAEQARAAGLPMVANATTQRRGSHGHLLIPIKAKLDNIGILRNDPHVANVRKDSQLLSPISQESEPELFSPLKRTIQAAQATLPGLPRVQAEESPSVASPVAKRVAVPPHVRAAMREAAAHQAAVAAGGPQVAKTPLLRATAKEFKPMLASLQQGPQPIVTPSQTATSDLSVFQPQGFDSAADNAHQLAPGLWTIVPAQADMSVSDDDAVRFYNVEEWSAMPYQRRRIITERRNQLRGGFGRYQNYSDNGRGVVNRSFSNSTAPYMLPELSETFPDVFGTMPINAHARQAPAPHLDPSAKDVPHFENPFTPLSIDTSPRRISPHTPGPLPRSWTIGSEQSRQVYGWKGGDGREIKFIGHGPDAEREPGYGRRGSNMGRGPRMIGMDGEDGSPEAPLAPRSRRHWAQLAGFTRQPCDNMEIVAATEQMPAFVGQSLFGHCIDCGIDSQRGSLSTVVA